jgi:long-chain acyl-CoA synthetase
MAENPADRGRQDVYQERPWLKLYPDYVPFEIKPGFNNGLELLQHAVHTGADRSALYYFDRAISYGELDRQSTALAAAFVANGLQRGDRLALFLQNVPQFLIALYATWKVGAIAVLCNPMYKARELIYHLNDSGAKGLVCLETLYQQVVTQTLPQAGLEFVITTSELDYLGDTPLPALLKSSKKQRFAATLDLVDLINQFQGQVITYPGLGPKDVAFLTYTSGTTGQPKGAMNTHGNVVFNATVYQKWMQLGPNDVVVGVAPFFHITGIIGHLAVAALTAIPVITFFRFDPYEMLRLIEKWRGSFVIGAITVFIALAEYPELTKRDLSSLKKVYSGGAPISPAIVGNFERLTGLYIHNIYGLTETTSPSHAVPFGQRAPVDPDSGTLSVGIPVPNTRCQVVDLASGAVLLPNEAGELLTAGPQIVAGYWQKPLETQNAIRDGFLYTGDVAKMDQDGWFYLVDRKKDMIIASGYKVWPREVEEVLYQHPAVRQAAVVGVADSYRGETVKAYVALKSAFETQVSPEELIEFCKARLANYKYPRQVEILPELPQTVTGKFLRRELRDKAANENQDRAN